MLGLNIGLFERFRDVFFENFVIVIAVNIASIIAKLNYSLIQNYNLIYIW